MSVSGIRLSDVSMELFTISVRYAEGAQFASMEREGIDVNYVKGSQSANTGVKDVYVYNVGDH